MRGTGQINRIDLPCPQLNALVDAHPFGRTVCDQIRFRRIYSGRPALRPSGHLRSATMFKIVPDNFVSNPVSLRLTMALIAPSSNQKERNHREGGFSLFGCACSLLLTCL